MDKQKLNAILSAMAEENVPQLIISDPAVIFYLTGAWIHPGERLLVLYLNQNGNHKLHRQKLARPVSAALAGIEGCQRLCEQLFHRRQCPKN